MRHSYTLIDKLSEQIYSKAQTELFLHTVIFFGKEINT